MRIINNYDYFFIVATEMSCCKTHMIQENEEHVQLNTTSKEYELQTATARYYVYKKWPVRSKSFLELNHDTSLCITTCNCLFVRKEYVIEAS